MSITNPALLFFWLLFALTPLQAQTTVKLEKGDPCPTWYLQQEDGTTLEPVTIDADHVLLLFWHYKCSHCQKALTKIDKFLANEHPKDLKIISIYPFASDQEKFWRYVNNPDNLLTDSIFVHSVDQKAKTRRAFSSAGAPPLLVLLDKERKIVALNFKAKQLSSIWNKCQTKVTE